MFFLPDIAPVHIIEGGGSLCQTVGLSHARKNCISYSEWSPNIAQKSRKYAIRRTSTSIFFEMQPPRTFRNYNIVLTSWYMQ